MTDSFNSGLFLGKGYSKKIKNLIGKITTTAGLEPARAEPKRFLIFRLNRSAMLPIYIRLTKYDPSHSSTRGMLTCYYLTDDNILDDQSSQKDKAK